MRRTLATIALLTILLAACGGDSDEAEPSRTTAGSATPGSVDTNFSGQGSEKFCSLARGYRDRLGTTDPAQLKALVQEAESSIKDLVPAAPSEIKGDVQVLASGASAFFQQLARVNYDITKLSPDAISSLQKPEFQASTQRLGAYSEKVCGISTSVP